MTGYLNTTKFVPSSGSALINGILTDTAWADTTIDIAFSQSASPYSYSGTGLEDLPANFATVSAAQQSVALFALDIDNGNAADDGFSVEGFTNIGVNNLGNTNSTTAEIRFAETSYSGLPTAMVGDFPGNDASSSIQDNGDVWFGTQYNYRNPAAGNYSWLTMIHEIGHAMGLSHGHDNFEYGTLPSNYDAMEYSVMSYRSYVGQSTSGGYTNETYGFAQTFMMADIAALQYMYGADYTTNSGDTVYSWAPDSGNTLVDGEVAISPGDNKIFATIWDGGGVDTYDLSAYTTAVSIDLNPGTSSLFSPLQAAYLGDGPSNVAAGNIYNALMHQDDMRSLIENAIGGSGNDNIEGNQANNTLNGGEGDDFLFGWEGDDTLIGGDGNDTVYGGNDNDVLYGYSGNDILDGGIDNDFINAGDNTELSASAGQIYRLYKTALNRDPDIGGMKNWVNAVDNGYTLEQIAESFVASQEFANLTAGMSNEQFVTYLYETVLGRTADAGGYNHWLDQMNSGMAKHTAILGFSESVEYTNVTQNTSISFATNDFSGVTSIGQLYRLYETVFDREADAGGLSAWWTGYNNGMSLHQITQHFLSSAEYISKYGNPENSEFVDLVYQYTFSRTPDAGGKAHYLSQLSSGMTREQMIVAIMNSDEARNKTDSDLIEYVKSFLPYSNDITGGSGTNVLIGGIGSDLYRFNSTAPTESTLFAVQEWDQFQFSGYGYASTQDIFDRLSENNGDTVFTDGDVSIVWKDTEVDFFTHDMFLIV